MLSGLTPDQLAYRIAPDANPISWLVRCGTHAHGIVLRACTS